MIIYRLYVKTHNQTGLKYLGFTKASDPHKYRGSGTYWIRHLKVHGYDYSTEILNECLDKTDVKHWGEYYSTLWNVVESKEWANLKPESGEGGFGIMSADTKKKISMALTGKIVSLETSKKISESKLGKKQKPCSDDRKAKLSASTKGKTKSSNGHWWTNGEISVVSWTSPGSTFVRGRAKIQYFFPDGYKNPSTINLERRIDEYKLTPKICPVCGDSVTYKKRNNKTCSELCSRIFRQLK